MQWHVLCALPGQYKGDGGAGHPQGDASLGDNSPRGDGGGGNDSLLPNPATIDELRSDKGDGGGGRISTDEMEFLPST